MCIRDSVDISSSVGIEQWTHDASFYDLPELHFDKNEKLYQEKGELQFPLCSIIAYLKIIDLVGARLIIAEATPNIVPETGKVVLLKPGVLHGVNARQSGTRISININIWDTFI